MNEWQIKEREVVMKTPIGSFVTTKKIDPAGVERKYISMQCPDWVCAVVEFGNEFLMVKQFRHGINRLIVEFPSGMVDAGEKAIDALYRELDEELGVKREDVLKCEQLYTGSPNPAFMENRMTCYHVVINGYGENHPDEDEFLDQVLVSRADMEHYVSDDDFGLMMRLAWEMYKKRA